LVDDSRKKEALAAARREIARRLARICSTLTPEEFEKLVDRMAGVQWKYDVLPAIPGSAHAKGAGIGEDPAPTGEHALPTGEHALPTGDHALPTGEQALPTGEHPTSTGEHRLRTGEHKRRS